METDKKSLLNKKLKRSEFKKQKENEINNNNNNASKKEEPEKSQFFKDEDEDFGKDLNSKLNSLEEDKDLNNQSEEKQWINRQRTLVVTSRAVSHQERFLVNDIIALLPHAKKEVKIEKNIAREELTEVCFNHSCKNALYFEHRKRDLILWLFKTPEGPLAKFQVRNIHTLTEIKLTGNCLKYSRPLLSFDKSFDTLPHLKLLKEMFKNTFNSPKNHPKTKPFYDHMICFYNVNNHIFFRNYQIVNELKEKFLETDDTDKLQLIEIGPRFSLNLIRIFEGPLGGRTIFENEHYIPTRALWNKNVNKFKLRKQKEQKEKEEVLEKIKNNVPSSHEWLDK